MAETRTIKRVGVWSAAKFQGIITGVLFFIAARIGGVEIEVE